jgi:hypothetical protein
MDNKNLFKEAIADAKAVREAALANAKAALEEALTPKLQSMLATKLQEMEYMEEEGYESDEEMEEGFDTEEFGFDRKNGDVNENEESSDLEEDFDLSEILAELEEENENLNEAKKEDEEESEDEEEESEETETEEVADMSVEDLKALIKDIVSQEMGGEQEMHAEPDADNAGGPSDQDADNADDEINLDELLAELDALGEGEDMEEESMYEAKRKMSKHEKGETKAQEKAEHASGKEKKEKSEMKEAIDTINTLRNELNEVNLLNAKLLYVNKIFKAKNLSESQKLKVIASFDKATTAKEAKVVFESLNANLTATAPKQAIKESIGFASRAAGVAPRKAIVETNDAITRMQKLANIIK